jgi:hypothetical protein
VSVSDYAPVAYSWEKRGKGGEKPGFGKGGGVFVTTRHTSGTSVGARERGQVLEQILDAKDLGGALVERHTDSGAGGGDVLERGSGGEVEGGGELLNKGPRVEGIEEVDVAGRAGNDCAIMSECNRARGEI